MAAPTGTKFPYDYSYQRRSTEGIVEEVRKAEPTWLSVARGDNSSISQPTHIYYDLMTQMDSCLINNGGGYNAGTSTFTTDGETAYFSAGDVIAFSDYNYEQLVVTSHSGHSLVTTTTSANAHADDAKIILVGKAIASGSTRQTILTVNEGTPRTTYSEIIRVDCSVPGSLLKAGNESFNTMTMDEALRQAYIRYNREMSLKMLFSSPVVESAGVARKTAGLLYWATNSSNAIKVSGSGAALTETMLNDLNAGAYDYGADLDVYICNVATARKISKFNTAQSNMFVYVGQDSDLAGIRGASRFTGDLPGAGMKTIVIERNMPAGLLVGTTSSAIRIRPLNDRTTMDWDSTAPDYDGICRTILGEYALQLENPLYYHGCVYYFTT